MATNTGARRAPDISICPRHVVRFRERVSAAGCGRRGNPRRVAMQRATETGDEARIAGEAARVEIDAREGSTIATLVL